MENFDWNSVWDKAVTLTVEYVPSILLALLTLWIGLRLIKWVMRLLDKILKSRDVDDTLRKFMNSLLGWVLKALLFVSVIQMLGVATTSFVAIIGAAGLAVGLALQGTLANFAGGVLILLFKPYKKDDLISAQGEFGVVKEIQIFVTILLTPENKTVIIPNGAMANGNITNFTAEGKIRVDMTIGVSYEADLKKAKEVLTNVVLKDELVLKDPVPTVAVAELADSSVNLVVRPWCDPAHYWDVHFNTIENAKNALDEAGISIPFPQRDVHIIDQSNK